MTSFLIKIHLDFISLIIANFSDRMLVSSAKEALDICCLNKYLMQSNMENNNTDIGYLGYMVLLKNGEGTWEKCD